MVPALLTGWAALVFIFDSEGHKLFPLPVNVQHSPAKHMEQDRLTLLTFPQQCQSADLVSSLVRWTTEIVPNAATHLRLTNTLYAFPF